MARQDGSGVVYGVALDAVFEWSKGRMLLALLAVLATYDKAFVLLAKPISSRLSCELDPVSGILTILGRTCSSTVRECPTPYPALSRAYPPSD